MVQSTMTSGSRLSPAHHLRMLRSLLGYQLHQMPPRGHLAEHNTILNQTHSRLWFISIVPTLHLVELRCGLPDFPTPTLITVAPTPRKVNAFSPPAHPASTITQLIQKPGDTSDLYDIPLFFWVWFGYVLNQSNRYRDTCAVSWRKCHFNLEYNDWSPTENALCCLAHSSTAQGMYEHNIMR